MASAKRKWNSPDSLLARRWQTAAWLPGWPLLLAGRVLDRLTGGLLARPGWSNTFRVLARRRP